MLFEEQLHQHRIRQLWEHYTVTYSIKDRIILDDNTDSVTL